MKNSDIKTFPFSKDKLDYIGKYHFGKNWPVVYILEDGNEIYIGETTNAYYRSKQHYQNPERQKLKNIHIITDEEYNKSAALDIESMLIQYMVADEKFIVQNGNGGVSDHNYYDRENYKSKFDILWKDLKDRGLVQKDLLDIRNSQIFKFSPYKSLTEEQLYLVARIKNIISKNEQKSIIVNGGPGTGKTVLASYLVKNLSENDKFKHLKIGFVVPMTSLRGTIKTVFKKIKGLKSGMVLGPNDVVKDKYDILIVDEAHRLQQRRNITNFASFDSINRELKLGINGTQLDWILKSSRYQILFYDKNQSIRPADIHHGSFSKIDAIQFNLKNQLRVKGGDRYISFINNLLDLEPSECKFQDYDFRIFDNISEMISEIKSRNYEYNLCRIIAGYAWPWKTKKGSEFDIEIDGVKLVWNSTTEDWVNSKNSINEVGCIHTVQGYDLNYAGIIIGPEITYNPQKHEIIIDQEKYKDINGKKSIKEPEELKRYIINIYKTLLTRAIYGTYVYIVDDNLRKYFKEAIEDLNYT